MSRHRNVRTLNVQEEYDGYFDVYGHSVEDDYCISPSVAEFMYDRNRKHQISSLLSDESQIKEDEEWNTSEQDIAGHAGTGRSSFSMPALNADEEVKLKSCLDELQNIVGESIPEPILIESVLKNEFDFEKSLQAILSQSTTASSQALPPNKKVEKREDREMGFLDRFPHKDTQTLASSGTKVVTPKTVLASGLRKDKAGFTQTEASKKTSQNFEGGPEELEGRNVDAAALEPIFKELKLASDASEPKLSVLDSTKALEEYESVRGNKKDNVNIVVVGHVDAGKSTLMGHLLYQLGAVNQRQMHKYEQESRKMGKQSFMYAWVLDETGEERSRGITMDVGHSKFETEHKVATLLDAPGHKDFIPSMITGAAQADVAVLVVDATRGEFETGFDSGGQTREHALLVRSLGVSQVIGVVNKLDNVGWSQARFDEICTKLKQFLIKHVGFKDKDIVFIPCSGLTGENLSTPPTVEALTSWYKGPTLLQTIDTCYHSERPVTKPLRISIGDVFKGQSSGFCVGGKLETGSLHSGDKVLVMPEGEPATIKNIMIDNEMANVAFAGDQITLSLGNFDPNNISVGSVICDLTFPIPVASRIQARIVVFNCPVPITPGYPVVFHYQSMSEPATIRRIVSQVNKATGEVIKKHPRCLVKNTSAFVVISINRPICVELYRNIKELGRFMLRSAGQTIAAGMITEIYGVEKK